MSDTAPYCPNLARSDLSNVSPGVAPENYGRAGWAPPLDVPPLFSGVLPRDYIEFSSAGRRKEFSRGETLYYEGAAAGHALMLTAGVVKITQLGWSGSEVIIRLSVPGDVLGVSDLLSTGTHCTSAQAFRPCRAILWDASVFRALLDRFPVLNRNMVGILRGDLIELQERFREVATERVASRVARQLVRLLLRIGCHANGTIAVNVSREELAQMTGTTLFTVSRLLSAWEVPGIVKAGRETVLVCNVPALRAIADEAV